MDFNTFLTRLGIDPDNFKNIKTEPIITDDGFIFYTEQRSDERICPYCHGSHAEIKGYHHVDINCSDNENIKDILRVKKVRFMCLDCHRTFTPPLKGIARRAHISDLTKQLIYNDFTRKMTFQGIASKYQISNGYVVALFDAKFATRPEAGFPRFYVSMNSISPLSSIRSIAAASSTIKIARFSISSKAGKCLTYVNTSLIFHKVKGTMLKFL